MADADNHFIVCYEQLPRFLEFFCLKLAIFFNSADCQYRMSHKRFRFLFEVCANLL